MRNLKLIIEYDGTHYQGWQSQKNGLTIQDVLEKALSQILNQKIRLNGSGRTDSGVHALGQVASFKTESVFDMNTGFGMHRNLQSSFEAIRGGYRRP
jgi:tRNA pseudouridine38-40 synthase